MDILASYVKGHKIIYMVKRCPVGAVAAGSGSPRPVYGVYGVFYAFYVYVVFCVFSFGDDFLNVFYMFSFWSFII